MNRMKTLLVVILAAVLLTFSVSGTIAWLSVKTEKVENTFTPAKVDTKIEETFDKNVKSAIEVKNVGTIPVYVRVSVSGYWCDSTGNIIEPWDESFAVGSDWLKGSDGYYYYKTPLAAGSTTLDLLDSNIEPEPRSDGAHLEVTVIHQSIQAEPTSVVADEWKVTLNGTTITGIAASN